VTLTLTPSLVWLSGTLLSAAPWDMLGGGSEL
jgi:hypothetical protein